VPTSKPRLLQYLIAALIAAAVACAPAYAATPTWLLAHTVPNQSPAPSTLQVAMDGSGNLTELWDDDPDNCGAGTYAADRMAGSEWSAAQNVNPNECFGKFAENASGAGAMVWSHFDFSNYPNYNYQIWASTRTSTGAAWSTPKLLDTNTTNSVSYTPGPDVVVDANGIATVAWLTYDGTSGNYYVKSSRSAVGVDSWSSPATLPSAYPFAAYAPVMKIDGSGHPLLLFEDTYVFSGITYIDVRYLEATEYDGTAWSDPVHIGFVGAQYGGSIDNVSLAVGSGGTAAASWTLETVSSSGGTPSYSVQVATATDPTTWGLATVPSSSSPNTMVPSIAVDSQGRTEVAWVDSASTCCTYSLHSTLLATDGKTFTAGSPDPLFSSGNYPSVSTSPLAFDAHDNAILVDIEGTSVEGRLRPAGSTSWSSPHTLNTVTNPQDAVLTADPLGNAAAAWYDVGAATLEGAIYDGAGPAFSAYSLPGSGLTDSPLNFSATAADWSPPVGYAWDFGDGGSGSGDSTSHSYSGAGAYNAGVTATDALGNSRSETASVAVASPPSAPPGPPPPPPPPPPDLPPPVAGLNFDIVPLGGVVLVQEPGTNNFVPLTKPSQIRNGSIIDARKGRVRITIDDGAGHLDTADFYEGMFKFVQENVATSATAAPPKVKFADLYLVGGKFKGCPKAPKHPRIASLAKARAAKGKSIQHLWGSGHGAFRTVGRYASATIRGTTWLTDDRCDGTLARVTAGKVGVRDFVKNKTIVVKKGKSYFAHPK
jgi:hypothetical protein